tara:strand:- start:310 stop:1203 length:894 start_codon:yes stop_codon:yes gene_type:complete
LNNFFIYKFFGLIIETNFPISFLSNKDSTLNPHFRVSLKSVLKNTPKLKPLTSVFVHNYIYYKDSNENLFKISKNSIEIVSKNKDFFNIGLSLVGLPIGYYFFLNNFQVLHGSAVSIKNKAVCFVGQSSIGKSVLSASLINRDVKFIAEDLIILEDDLNLKNDANWVKLSSRLTSINSAKIKEFFIINKDKRERLICKLNEDFLQNNKRKASLCYFPIWGETFDIKKASIKESFTFLFTNSYKQKKDNCSDINYQENLDKISKFIESTKCFFYQRTKDLNKLEDDNILLLEHIDKYI